jgi:hypothetical protein
MDQIALTTPPGDFGEHSAWRSAVRAVGALLPRAAGEIRDASVRALFENGRATGWLTNILRSEIFAHGHRGDKPEPEEKWLLTRQEFERVMAMMLQRYRTTPPTELMRVPQFLSLLYGWRQAANDAEVAEWVQAQTATDDGLLAFLASVRHWSASSTFGVQYPLRRQTLQPLLDFDDAIKRLTALSENNNIAQDARQKALELLDAARMGDKLDH